MSCPGRSSTNVMRLSGLLSSVEDFFDDFYVGDFVSG